ncbi:MAG: hypothetical protein NC342_05400 [Pseudoflavonifractor sp.]|nr:hypothetical protein [Alloprevotella sp.]MCM1116953.1 hypothetical protein [Pseudoflavonifractor sp.]
MDNTSTQTLSYKDEADRAYGAAGMAVAIVVCNAEDIMLSVDLDAPSPADMIEMDDSYYLAGQRAKSVSAAWQQLLSAYRASLIMASGNILARYMVGQHAAVGYNLRSALRKGVETDGRDTCQLDDDEIDTLFNRTFDYLTRVFSHPTVGSVTTSLVDRLIEERHIGRTDLLAALHLLSRL